MKLRYFGAYYQVIAGYWHIEHLEIHPDVNFNLVI